VADDRDDEAVPHGPAEGRPELRLPPPSERLFNSLVRRLSRLGLDLHDGALQDLAALRAEIDLLVQQLESELRDHEHRSLLLGRMADLTARVDAITRDLRNVAASLRPRQVAVEGIRLALAAEIRSVTSAGVLDARLELDAGLPELGSVQRETLVLFVREGLRNARRHSSGREVTVRVFGRGSFVVAEVADDGRGFRVARRLRRAAQADRLGLVAMSEQVRLAGGELEVTSRPGGPTLLRATLPVQMSGHPLEASTSSDSPA
jgi:signal transduction histidine kinase